MQGIAVDKQPGAWSNGIGEYCQYIVRNAYKALSHVNRSNAYYGIECTLIILQ